MLYESGNGIILTKENIKQGMPKYALYDELKKNGYEQVAHGVYAAPEAWVDEEYVLQHRCSRAVFSHDTALYYHGLVDREPFQPTLTIYTGYNTKRLTESGVKVYTVKRELLELGKIAATNSYGNEISIYDLERTICDLVRSRNSFEIQDFQTALKTYVKKQDKDLNKLMAYAGQFRVDNVLRKYMEVLL